jgi:hypothetical protein
MPGLTFTAAFTSLLPMPTFAPTPTLGLAFVPPAEPLLVPEVEDCAVDTPWFIVELELMSVDRWLAETPLATAWPPPPTFTPGLTFAPRLTSLLLMPTLAPTPTFGFTLSDEDLPLDAALVDGLFADGVPEAEGRRGAELDPDADDWVPVADWFRVDEEFTSRAVWFAVTPLVTDWLAGADAVEPVAPEEVVAAASGMQSICTGLFEFSLACPVVLSASLPAFGWFSSLHRGLAFGVVLVVPMVLVVVGVCCVLSFAAAGAAVWARTGVARPRTATVAILLMKWLRIMFFLLQDGTNGVLSCRQAPHTRLWHWKRGQVARVDPNGLRRRRSANGEADGPTSGQDACARGPGFQSPGAVQMD